MLRDLFIRDEGQGLPLLFIHGYPLNHTIWHNQFSLAKRFRVIAADLPGFGKSSLNNMMSMYDYADLMAVLLVERKIDRAILIGHSMGGYISLAFAERHPERLSGLGLVCSQAAADTPEVKEGRIKNAERVGKEGTEFIIEAMIEKLLAPANKKARPELVAQLRMIMKDSSSEGVISALKAMAGRPDQFETLRKLDVPVFVAAGSDDVLIASEKSVRMAEVCRRPTYQSFAQCGHMAMMEDPSAFNASLTSFLESIK